MLILVVQRRAYPSVPHLSHHEKQEKDSNQVKPCMKVFRSITIDTKMTMDRKRYKISNYLQD